MARRARRRSKAGDYAKGIILGTVGVCLLAGLAGAAYWLQRSRLAIDPKTLCAQTGPAGINVIIFDRSDPVTPQQAQYIRQALQRTKQEAEVGTRFDIFTFDGDAKNVLLPLLSVCVPKKVEDANELTENPARIRRRYEEQFSRVLDETIDSLLKDHTRPNSPIIESLRAATQTSFGTLEGGAIPLRLTLISDMVQHTGAVSHLRAEPSFAKLSRQPDWASLRPQLKGAETTILYVQRAEARRAGARVQNSGHQMFWRELIAASGGRITLFEPL